MSWNGTNETERTFFDSNGAQLGDSRTNIDTWNNGTTDVTNTNTNYHNANGEWLVTRIRITSVKPAHSL